MKHIMTGSLLLLVGCADAADGGSTTVDISFFTDEYTGAEVCVEGTCGVVGEVESFEVSPALSSTSITLEVTLDAVSELFEYDYSPDHATLGGGLTRSLSIGLFPDEDDNCFVYVTNLRIGDGMAQSLPPSRTGLCGVFQNAP